VSQRSTNMLPRWGMVVGQRSTNMLPRWGRGHAGESAFYNMLPRWGRRRVVAGLGWQERYYGLTSVALVIRIGGR
jgi:hypothetical protein